MTTQDKGLKQAIARQPVPRLASNFTYRTMQRINEQALLKERKAEKRLFIAWTTTVSLMIGGCVGYLGWVYAQPLLHLYEQFKSFIPDKESILSGLPILTALILLAILNHWLQRKIRYFQETSNGF